MILSKYADSEDWLFYFVPERIPASVSEFSMRFLAICFCLPNERLKDTFSITIRVKSLEKPSCLLGANFSTKEISIVSSQGVRTVYQRKSVIRQKLGMEEKGDIVEFLS